MEKKTTKRRQLKRRQLKKKTTGKEDDGKRRQLKKKVIRKKTSEEENWRRISLERKQLKITTYSEIVVHRVNYKRSFESRQLKRSLLYLC